MYNYNYGYPNEEISWKKDRLVGGVSVGIIIFGPLNIPVIPGDVWNASTFNFPVLFQNMDGLTLDMVVNTKSNPKVLDGMINAGRKLEQAGCRAVVGSCGFMANYQPELAAALNIPVFISPLVQTQIILTGIKPSQKVGIITANGKVLSKAPALKKCGVENSSRIVIVGAEKLTQMHNILAEVGHYNPAVFEKELVCLAEEMVGKNPEIGAILLECSNMPSYAWAIQRKVQLPVFDFYTLVNWVHSAMVRSQLYGYV